MQLSKIIFTVFIFSLLFISCNYEITENSITISGKVDTIYKLYFTDSIFTYKPTNKPNGNVYIYTWLSKR